MSSRRDTEAALMASESRRESRTHQRVVVKAGTSLLTRGADRLNLEVMATLVGQIAQLHARGSEVALVTSGAVSAGRHVLAAPREGRDLPLRQVLAAVGQGHLMQVYEQFFSWHDITVAQALLSRRDLSDRLSYLNVRNTLMALLERRAVPIINENDVVAVDELAGEVFGDNDTLSALVANLVDADLLVLLGEVEGLYTADPNVDPKARLIPTVERLTEEIEASGGPSWGDKGRGGMATKLEAARVATASGVEVVIASGLERDILTRLADGESIGTLFPATGTKMESRKRWMLSGLSRGGEIVVDNGAANALRGQAGSLLPAGVTDVVGSFDRGEIVSILDPKGGQVACGIANYSSDDVAKIKGVHSDRIEEILERRFGDEIVHRSNMVTL